MKFHKTMKQFVNVINKNASILSIINNIKIKMSQHYETGLKKKEANK